MEHKEQAEKDIEIVHMDEKSPSSKKDIGI